jgi:hypothetical protein
MNLIRRIENWAKENPVRTTFLFYPISELVKFVFDKANGADYSSLLGYLIEFLQIDFTVKTWHVLLLVVATVILIAVIGRMSNKNFVGVNRIAAKRRQIESSQINLAKHPFNSSTNSNQILNNEVGTFSIWAHVSDIHNRVHTNVRYMYIVGYATNGGNQSNNRSLARYPNAWAIQRITPTPSDNRGIWRFWCNNVDSKSTILDCTDILPGGWHLFSVAWSSSDNYIKFIVDEKVIAKSDFVNWPSDFSASMILGTWPTKSADHFFDSKIGPWRFIPMSYSEKLIRDYFKKRPEN